MGKKKEASETLSEFLDFLDECERQYQTARDAVGLEDRRLQDLLHELKERDTAKAPKEVSEEYGYFECPSCGKAIYASDNFESHKFCLNCGQRLKWED